MTSLMGKVAIVTGSSLPNGIGLAIAKQFAKAGASVFLVAEGTAEQLQAAQAACKVLAPNVRIEYAAHDLSIGGSAEEMVAQAASLFGRVDILVNNAAARISKNLGDYTRADFETVVGVNLAAPFFACQAVIPLMRRQGGGRIINIASQLAKVALPQRALYGLTKAAVVHLTKSLACELGKDGIVVNSISPGPTSTQRSIQRKNLEPELQRRLESDIPLGRFGEPTEIAELAYFLATTDATFLQGEDICIDGGYTIH
jgi:NAD(P)-dependent dehydrogenase (short-subunit alcohol dehydrogenase family)